VLLLLFGLPLVAPALALLPQPASNLPACCRAAGAHHCLRQALADDGAPRLAAPRRCGVFPVASTAAASDTFATSNSHRVSATPLPRMHPVRLAQVAARAAQDHAWRKRGPPTLRLA